MQKIEISQIDNNPNDYQRAEELLGSDLGCDRFFKEEPDVKSNTRARTF